MNVHLPDQADLIGFQYWPERIQPGEGLHVTLYWQATHPVSRAFQTTVQLIAPEVGQVRAQSRALTPQSVSIDDWHPGQVIAERFTVATPIHLPIGAHRLAVHLTTYETHTLPLHREGDASFVDRVVLGYVIVPLEDDMRAVLSKAQPADAQLGHDIRLLGFEAPAHLSPGQTFDVRLFWEAQQRPKEDYIVFVHLMNASGQLVTSHDGQPMGRRYPTAAWYPGEIVPDIHPIPLGEDVPTGEYRLQVGMYRWPSLERLPARDGQGVEHPDRVVVLGTIQVR